MNRPLFATMVVHPAHGLALHGPFAERASAANWIADTSDTYGCPVALYPPDSDPLTTRATTDVAGDVIALDDDVADALFTDADAESDPTGAVVVSVLVDPPVRRYALWIGPFTGRVEAQTWINRAADTARTGDHRATMRIHPLHRVDTVPAATTAPRPDSKPVAVDEVS
ncbi:hypothetical protein [Amycolatopsis sp. cmx-11-32]|uniref:hypothetical protein n=1 Tax=Amycolatopsis sp. cmx-11-32 TaxID=2785796 RepID=UPI0039E327CF